MSGWLDKAENYLFTFELYRKKVYGRISVFSKPFNKKYLSAFTLTLILFCFF